MAVTDLVGADLPTQTVVIERAPVSAFAAAVTDRAPIFHDARAAEAAGFDAVPAPPTYAFAMALQSAWTELQAPVDGPNPVMRAIGELTSDGGMILHGEQAFTYHRPILVGDRLTGNGRITDITRKDDRRMTFIVSETDWHDETGAPVVTSKMTLIHRP